MALFPALLARAGPALADTTRYDEASRKVAQDFVRRMGGELKTALDAGGSAVSIKRAPDTP